MENRIVQLFKKKNRNVLSIYFTAGFPALNDTVQLLQLLQAAGVDMIEIGMPFSDPLADGPVIQHSSEEALKNGMTLKVLFEQLKDIRKTINIPLILMGYLNPVMQFGVDNFCKVAAEIGIDGVILPDLPMQEYLNEYKSVFEKNNLLNIFLITPQTTEKRIRFIDEHSNGFVYMVSSSSTTGNSSRVDAGKEAYFLRIKNMKLKNPTMIGFGISDKKSFINACEYANGAIIGSAFINALQEKGELKVRVNSFINKLLS